MESFNAESVFTEAKAAAESAAKAENDSLPPEQSRGFDCGFAWVTIKPARGPFVAYLKKAGIGKSGSFSGGPGYGIWYSSLHSIPTQSVGVHVAAARAFADVLKRYGIDASSGSRLD